MQITVARAFAKAPLDDQLAATSIVQAMTFDRLTRTNPRRWVAATSAQLLAAGMPARLVDGTSPGATRPERVAAAKAKHTSMLALLATVEAQAQASSAEVGAYTETAELLDGLLAEAVWAGHADATATTTIDGTRWVYDDAEGSLSVLANCPTNQSGDHRAQVADRTHLTQLLDDSTHPDWTCQAGTCPATAGDVDAETSSTAA